MTKKTKISGLLKIQYPPFKDNRGRICSVYNYLHSHGGFCPKEITHTLSYPRTLRGLHVQGWDRIVYPINGSIYNVFVDIREHSETFGVIDQFLITDKNRCIFFVPSYVANGYVVLGNQCVDYFYFLGQPYNVKFTMGILWKDTNLHIDWKVKNPIVSEKDKKNKTMRELFPNHYENFRRI